MNDCYGLNSNRSYNYFSHDNAMQVDIMSNRKLSRHDVNWRLGCYLLVVPAQKYLFYRSIG